MKLCIWWYWVHKSNETKAKRDTPKTPENSELMWKSRWWTRLRWKHRNTRTDSYSRLDSMSRTFSKHELEGGSCGEVAFWKGIESTRKRTRMDMEDGNIHPANVTNKGSKCHMGAMDPIYNAIDIQTRSVRILDVWKSARNTALALRSDVSGWWNDRQIKMQGKRNSKLKHT